MKNKYKIIIAAAALAAFFALGYITRKVTTKPVETGTKVDTVTVRRTAAASDPDPVDVRPAAPVPVSKDRLRPAPQDSAAVLVPAETRTYRDTLSDGTSYEAVVTGVQPSLQALTITYPERTITKSVAEPYEGWMLSATADIGAYAAPQITVASKAALEISYNTGPLHMALQGGIISTPTSGSWQPSPYIGARLTVDIYRFR